jgi:hypothetical protein
MTDYRVSGGIRVGEEFGQGAGNPGVIRQSDSLIASPEEKPLLPDLSVELIRSMRHIPGRNKAKSPIILVERGLWSRLLEEMERRYIDCERPRISSAFAILCKSLNSESIVHCSQNGFAFYMSTTDNCQPL